MIGQRENTIKTLARILVLSVQGLLMGILLSITNAILIPIAPFMMAVEHWRMAKRRLWITKICLVPFWLVMGCVFTISSIFGMLVQTIVELKMVAIVEWKARILSGNPLKPNGKPLNLPTNQERTINDLAVTIGVLKDYNAEAREHGQGIPIDEEKL